MNAAPSFALLVVRVGFGLFIAAHGYNKIFGGGKLKGTAGWFGSMGMKWPKWQARMAATTEIGSGLLFALGLATPFAAAGMIGLMIVAIVTAHRKNGFFVFRPGQGWEYCASIAIMAFGVGTIGAGKYSIDHAIHKDVSGWTGALITLIGVVGAAAQLAICYRPPKPAPAAAG
ncbi:MAG: DoxX family protein [Ilumatobacteraceae bacterium]|nr:DoxX family protein [Ilumatobacteraceae bacterium]